MMIFSRNLITLAGCCIVLLFSLLAGDAKAQTGCNTIPSIVIQSQYDSICPGEIDTISVIGSLSADTSIWFRLSESGWQSTVPTGTYGIDIASWKYQVYGLFSGSGSTRVYEFNGYSWASVTSTLPLGYDFGSLTLNPSTGQIYVAGTNSTTDYANVWKWTGSAWSIVGSSNFSNLPTSKLDLEVYADTSVYLAYRSNGVYNRPYVMKYNGASWFVMDTVLSLGDADIVDIEISPNNIPYVAIYSNNLQYSMQLSRWNGNGWTVLGASNSFLLNGSCSNLDIEFSGNTLYYIWDNDLTDDVKLYQYSSGIWTNISLPGTLSDVRFPSIEIDHGEIVMSLHDEVKDTRPYFRRIGSSWLPYFVDQIPSTSYYLPKMVLGKFAFPNSLINSSFNSYTNPYLVAGAGLDSWIIDKTGTYALVGKDQCTDYRLSNLKFHESKILPTYDVDAQHVRCNGLDDASIELTSNPPGTILSYSWNTGDTTNFIDSLSPGEYIVDLQGPYCLIKDTLVVTEPDPLILNLQGVDESCDNGKDGMILNLSTGGTKPYEVSINGVAIDTGNVKHLNTGTYQVWLTDDNGCRKNGSATVGLGGTSSKPVLSQDTNRTLCADSILLSATHTNPNKEWWNWTDLNTTSFGIQPSNLSGGLRYVFVDRDNRVIASRGNGLVRRQYSQSSGWSFVNPPYNTVYPPPYFKLDYLNGVLVNLQYSNTGIAMHCLYDKKSTWKSFKYLPISGTINDVSVQHFNGLFYLFVSIESAPSKLYRFDELSDDWIEVNSHVYGTGIQKGIMKVNGSSQLLFAGVDQNDNLIIKSGDNSGLTVIDSATYNLGGEAFDIHWKSTGDILLYYYLPLTNKRYLLSYKNATWDTLASGNNNSQNVPLKHVKLYMHPYGQIIMTSRTGTSSRTYIHQYIRGELYLSHSDGFTVTSPEDYSNLAIYPNGDMISFINSIVERLVPKKESLSDSTYAKSQGLYQYVARNGECFSYSKDVWVNPALDIQASVINNVSCKDGSDGSAVVDITFETGTGPYSILWSNSATTDSLNDVPDNQYIVSITDNDNCVRHDTIVITEPDSLLIQSISTTSPPCIGGINGTAKATVSGGTLPYLYSWPGQSLIEQDSVVIPAQSFQLNVIDALGCEDSANAVVSGGTTSLSPLTITGADSSLCVSDSTLLTGTTAGPDYQWYDLTQGVWDTIGRDYIDRITYPSSDRYREMEFGYDEFNYMYVAGRIDPSNSQSPEYIRAHLFNKVGWSQIGENVAVGGEVRFLEIEARSVGKPVVAYVRRDSGSDSLIIKQWNDDQWVALFTDNGSIKSIDMKRNGSSVYFVYAKEGESFARFGEITDLGFIPIQQLAPTQVNEVQFDNNDNGTLSIFLLRESATTIYYDASLFLYDGTFTQITLNPALAWGPNSTAYITNDDEIYVSNYKRLERLTPNGWATIEPVGGVRKVNNDGVPFRQSGNRIQQYNSEIGWIQLNSPYGNTYYDFDPYGLPVIVEGKTSYVNDPYAYQFVPDAITGEQGVSYMAGRGEYVMLKAGSNDCYDKENAKIKSAKVLYDDYEYLYCPDDSSNVSATPIDFNDTTAIVWNTSDTIYDLGMQQGGQYIFTISDGICSITDTIVIEQVDDFLISVDSVTDISCSGEKDGYVNLDVTSDYGYYIWWSDIGLTNTITERSDLAPGIYDAALYVSGCNYYDTISFAINDQTGFSAPLITSGTDMNVCDSMPVSLTCTSDSNVSVTWMSFDSASTEDIDHTNLSYLTQFYTEIDKNVYTYRPLSNTNEMSIVKLNNKRWDEVWRDSLGYDVSSLFQDTAGNLLLSGQTGDYAQRKTEIVRIANGDTSLFATMQHPGRSHKNIHFEWSTSSLYAFSYTYSYFNYNSYRDFYFGKFNGSSWDSLPAPQVYVDMGYSLDVEQDASGNFWVGIPEDYPKKYNLYKMSDSGWSLEFSYAQDVDGQSSIHILPDGTLALAVRKRLSSYSYTFEMFTYDGNVWDTITDRHVNMVNSNMDVLDISHDPAGNMLFCFGGKLYTRINDSWEFTADLSNFGGYYMRFIERSCSYPLMNSSYEALKLNPATVVSSGNSISVTTPGIYVPFGERDGCYNDDACNVVVRPSLAYSIDALTDISCAGDTTGSLMVTVETGTAPYSYSWSSGDTSALAEGLQAGWHVVTVGDQTNCYQTDSFEIIEPPAINIQVNQLIDVSCASDTNGQINLSATGGTGMLGILWSTGDSTWSLSGLSSGNYPVSITDSLGCSSDSVFFVNAFDSLPPQLITSSVILYLDSSGQASLSALQPDTFYTDDCGLDSVILSKEKFTCFDTGLTKIGISAYDISNNASFDSLDVVVYDTILPILQSYAHPVVMLDSSGTGVLALSAVDSGSYDNCGLASLQLSLETFTCNQVGLQTIWLTAIDNNGNTDSLEVLVNVLDLMLPTLAATPNDLYLDASGNATFNLLQMAVTSSDNCGIDSVWAQNYLYTCIDEGSNSNWVFAKDLNGNMDSVQLFFQIFDSLSPVARPFTHYTAALNSGGFALIDPNNLDSVSYDNCSINNMSVSIDSVTCANVGQLTATFKVTDPNGLTDSAELVLHIEDNLLPQVIVKSASVYLDNLGNAILTVAEVDNGSNDNCGIQQMSLSKDTFHCADTGSNQVWLVATDVNGNRDSLQALVNVHDTIKPIVSGLMNDTLYLDQNGQASVVASSYDLGSTDNCGGLSFSLAQNNFSCADLGMNSVLFTVTDASNNSSSINVNLFVRDTIPPVLTCFGDTGICVGKSFSPNPLSSDNCSATVQQLTGPSNSTSLATGTYTYTYKAEDASGNSSTCSYVLTVSDYPVVDLGLDTAVHRGDQINLTVKAGYESYDWSTGSTDRQITATINSDTTFWVEVVNEFGCITSDTIKVSISFVDIEELFGNNETIRIYPNPTSSKIYIEFKEATPEGLEFDVLTLRGQLVEGIPVDREFNRVSLDFSLHPTGMYWIRVNWQGQAKNIPVIVK